MYKREVLDSIINGSTNIPPFTDGSIEVKAAWREFDAAEGEEIRSRYLRTTALVKDYKSGVGVQKELGLIGFHIVQKTPLRPQWVWSSFEHVDNCPTVGQSPPVGAKFSLFGSSTLAIFPPKSTLPVTDATYKDALTGKPLIATDDGPTSIPMHVVREVSIDSRTTQTNARYHTALRNDAARQGLTNSIWANYVLVLTQWPTDPMNTLGGGSPFPDDNQGLPSDMSIANTSMETYFQRSFSCMRCHQSSDKLDFVFFPLVHAQASDPLDGSPTELFTSKLRARIDEARQKSFQNQRRQLGIE